jgi:hypothetical protein
MGDPLADFISVLRDVDKTLASARERLASARVDDDAFGKLFEARAVRDAYHERLPELERDFDEARAVLAHFVTGLEDGLPIVTTSTAPIPRQSS